MLKEALSRGHQITALVAHPAKLAPVSGRTTAGTDVLAQAKLASQLKGHDAVISAFSGHAQGDVYGYYVRGIHSIIGAVKDAALKTTRSRW